MGIAIESLVAVLLAVTIGYCVLVNRKLSALRSDQSEFKSIVRELNLATDHAAQAIEGLRQGAATAEESLGGQLDRVKILDKQLRESIDRGDALLARLAALPRASEIADTRARADRSGQAPTPARPMAAPERKRQIKRPIGLSLLNAQRRASSQNDEAAA